MKRRFGNQEGVTLIEIIIGVAIGLLVGAAMLSVFNTQNQVYIRTDDQRELNGLIDTTFGLVSKNVRMAGYRVPTSMAIFSINNINIGGGTIGTSHLQGTSMKIPFLSNATMGVKNGTDAVMILQTDNDCKSGNFIDNSVLVTNTGTSTVSVCQPNCFTAATGPYVVGNIALVSGPTSAPPDQRLGYLVKVAAVTINQSTPGICSGAQYTTVQLTGLDEMNFWACPGGTVGGCTGAPPVNQEIVRLQSPSIYYVGVQDQLLRLPIDGGFNPEVLSDGVEDLQIRYDLIPTCTTAQWCTGCVDCNARANYTAPAIFNDEIRALRIGMVLKSLRADQASFANKGRQVTLFDHVPPTTPDSFRRKAVTQMVRVKNLELKDF